MTLAAEMWSDLVADRPTLRPHEYARRYGSWFKQSCAEGNPPDRLRRDSPSLSERFDACTIEGLNGCLIWDGPVSRHNTPRIPGRGISARKLALTRRDVEVPSHRVIVPVCGSNLCVRFEHLAVSEHHWGRRNSTEYLIGRLQVVAMQLGHTPTTTEWDRQGYVPSVAAFRLRFGDWAGACKAAGLKTIQRATDFACHQGHPWTETSTQIDYNGKRRCRICRAAASLAYYYRRKAQA